MKPGEEIVIRRRPGNTNNLKIEEGLKLLEKNCVINGNPEDYYVSEEEFNIWERIKTPLKNVSKYYIHEEEVIVWIRF